MRFGRGVAATVFTAVVSRACGRRRASASSPRWRARASRYATSSGRSARVRMKLHEPTDGSGASSPGDAPAATGIRLRNGGFAGIRAVSSAPGAVESGPDDEHAWRGVHRRQDLQVDRWAADAGERLVDDLALDEGEVELPCREERHVLGAALRVARLDRERRVDRVDRLGDGGAVDGEPAARRRGPQDDDEGRQRLQHARYATTASRYTPAGGTPMTRSLCLAALLLTVQPPAAHGEPVQITIAPPAEATTMDPGRSTQVLTVNYFVNLYDTLTRWDGSLRLEPGLAVAWKNVNDTTWEFTLRQGVKFHDGVPLAAEDVRATLERNLVPGRTVVQAGFATIESVQVANPTTIRIVTKKPDPLLLVRLAQSGAQILPARLTTEEAAKELARRPVGTGAYRFVEWVKDERLVMEANRDWWGWEGRPPAIARGVC